MAARLGFGVAVHVEPEILLVDEVLAVGDESFQRKCIERIKLFQREGRTIFVVTHAVDLIRQIGSRAAVLDQGHLLHVGEPGDAIRILRESLLRRGIEMPSDEAYAPTERTLVQSVRFTDVAVAPVGGKSFLRAGDHLEMTIGFEAERPHDDLIFAFNILDDTGALMVGANSELVSGEAIAVPTGPGRYVFDVGPIHLGPGLYEVAVGIHNRDGLEYDHRDKAATVQVATDSRLIGRLATEVHGALERSTSSRAG
jgi:ABC-2 type transport system ATP-binding protein